MTAASSHGAAAALAVLLLVFAAGQVKFDLRDMAWLTRKAEVPAIKLGEFVAAHYPADTKVLADGYAYLPPALTNVTFTSLQTDEQLGQIAPELIILTRNATGVSAWKKAGTAFADGVFVKDERYPSAAQVEAYLDKLASPSSGWSVVREDASEVLLQRKR